MKKILALAMLLMLIGNVACAELVAGQQSNWLVASIDGKYEKVAEVLSIDGFAPLEGVMPNGTEPELYFAPEDSESPIRFFYYTTGYGDPASLAQTARESFIIYYDDCTVSELTEAVIAGKDASYFHYSCSYEDEQGGTAYEQSLICYFPIDDSCYVACIISFYVNDSSSLLSEEALMNYLNTAAAAIAFEE